jgi:hypothetical protein
VNKEEFTQRCREQCELCRNHGGLRYRPETREFIHEYNKGNTISITICRANDFRKHHPEFQ